MPVDASGRYWVPGSYQHLTISRTTRRLFPRARDSLRFEDIPYPSTVEIMARMDADGESWYQHAGEDLYLHDLLFQVRIQTARRASQRVRRFPLRDRVLDRLIEEGTFDRRGVTTPNASEEVAMQHSSAMVQRLLMRVEHCQGHCPLRHTKPTSP
jgi:hypothetical protein